MRTWCSPDGTRDAEGPERWRAQPLDTIGRSGLMVATSTPSGSESAWTAKPWLWLEISTRLVSLKRTG